MQQDISIGSSNTDTSLIPEPLSSHTRKTLAHYFSQLQGQEITGLYSMVMTEVEKPLIDITLVYCGQNQTKTAKMLGLSRSTLRKKMALYGLS